MIPERWQRVKQLLDEALAVESSERAAFLDRTCAGELELRREVESLLASHEQAGTGFLKNPAVDLRAVVPLPTPLYQGRRVGVYQILEEIGHGGMGEVYRAVRADGQYEKEVAVKLVRGGYDTGSMLERFRNERQILASLDHPNIARLIDGGTTEDGIPYLVMELIEGKPIDQYCDEHQLTITERLQMFRQVCAAVQFAHQRLVIHRDIKPSNVLVTSEGVPKLLDFGIAKILAPIHDAQTTLTQAMTPEYASPEQIRGEPITTATDVYSLGVVLYQLLTGRSPYQGDTSSPHKLAMAVCDTDPARPSAVVLSQGPQRDNDAAAVAKPEFVSRVGENAPAKLRRRLAGDLDNIVLMALRKEPARRYASVEQFAEDIRRHLEGLPVTATKGSWSYRAGKFVGRHRTAMAASVLVAVSIVAGVAATIRQARIATAERIRAEKRFDDVRKLANSLIFEIHDSIQSLPGATPSRKLLLDRAVEYLDKLSQDAGGDVDLQRELAFGYQRLSAVQGDTSQSNLGQISNAAVSIGKSIALFEAVARANPRNVMDQLNLAMAYRRRAFPDIYERTGPQEIAQAMAVTEPLMRTDGAKPEVRNERALELQIRAAIEDADGDRLKAVDTQREQLALRKDILRTNPEFKGIRRGVAHGTVELGYQLGRFGNRDEGVQLIDDGIAQHETLVKEIGTPDVVRDTAASELRRGQIKLMKGDVDAALTDFQRARERTARLAKLDPENKMLQSDMCGFDFEDGRAYVVNGKSKDGLPLVQRSAQCFHDLHLEADTGPGTGLLETWIGEAQARAHNLPEALKHFQSGAAALAADLEKYDDARCDLAMVQTKIGNTLLAMGKVAEASEQYRKALETAKLSFSLEHMDLPALYAAADAYAGLGDVAVAEANHAKDIAAKSSFLTQAHAAYANSLNVWKRIPYPSPMSGNGYLARPPQEVARQMASVRP
jgi:non-specific serine/threonine protein kinase/serine/threonine-protein kinase